MRAQSAATKSSLGVTRGARPADIPQQIEFSADGAGVPVRHSTGMTIGDLIVVFASMVLALAVVSLLAYALAP